MTSISEQFVFKSGITCVFGSNYHDIVWSNLISDFLLLKSTESSKYEKILCVLLDRSNDDFKFVSIHDKVIFLSEDCDDFSSESQLSSLSQKLESSLETFHNMSSLIIIYSFSEIVLRIGIIKGKKLTSKNVCDC